MQVASATKMTARVASQVGRRHFSKTSATNAKVAVIGAAGGIGQPLSLLMKQSPYVDDLALFDVVNTPVLPRAAGRISPRIAWGLVLGSGAVGLAIVKAFFNPFISESVIGYQQ